MRVEVKSNRSTWLLVLLAIAISGAIALWRFAQREQPRPEPQRDVVEVEIVE